MAHAMGELDPAEARELLSGSHVGRLTCHGGEQPSLVSLRYTPKDPDHVTVELRDAACAALARAHAPVRFEVDEVEGPARWSTVIGWGYIENPTDERDRYVIRFTDLRGFYRGARPAR